MTSYQHRSLLLKSKQSRYEAMTAEVHARISNIFVQHLNIEPPSPDTDLMESGTIDSLTLVDLLSYLEQEFCVQIPLKDLDLNCFRSIARIVEFIEIQLPKSGVALGSHSRV